MADIFGTPNQDGLIGTAGEDFSFGDSGGDASGEMGGDVSGTAAGSPPQMTGGPGDDTFVDTNVTADTHDGAGGTDTIDYSAHSSNVSVYLNAFGNGQGHYGDILISIENVITGSGNDTVWGTSGTNRIETGAGNDTLLSNGGGDTLIGGAGDDYYYDAYSDDVLIETETGGIDTVSPHSAVYTLPDFIENLANNTAPGDGVFTGNALNNAITGASGNDTLIGLGGNDILDGLGGYDQLYGGIGDDTYVLRPGYDDTGLVVELADEGTDLVVTYLPSYVLPEHVENLRVGPVAGLNHILTGNQLANIITGGEGGDTLYGLDGDDSLDGSSGNDTIYGGNGNDALLAYTGANLLYGEAGDDTLYVAVTSNNLVLDGGDGYDTLDLRLSGSYSGQIANIEQVRFTATIVDLTLTAQQAATGLASNALFFGDTGAGRIVVNLGTGEQFDGSAYQFAGSIFSFTINGAGGNEVIRGSSSFASTLNGGGGADTIYGGAQDDTITGGTGSDTFYGGGGSDRLNAEVGDALVDGGAGFDTLAYSASGTVTGTLANLEYFLLLSGASVSLSAAQLVAGFGSAGTFAGTGAVAVNLAPGGGALSLSGYTINPGSNVAVTINGSTANDQIKGITGSVNTLNGGDGADQIRGGTFADTISGGAGNDKIFGAGGPDILTGGAGADQFRYLFASDSVNGTGADRITDFLSGTDRLNFALLDADPVAAGQQALSFIDTAAFSATGAAQVRYAASGADLLVQVDLDGNGTADMEIVLAGAGAQVLTGGDFML